jgi:hypothetical protein
MISLTYDSTDSTLTATVPFHLKDDYKNLFSGRQLKWIALSKQWRAINVTYSQLEIIVEWSLKNSTVSLTIDSLVIPDATTWLNLRQQARGPKYSSYQQQHRQHTQHTYQQYQQHQQQQQNSRHSNKPPPPVRISNPYELLGLSPSAPIGLVHAAMRWWAKQLHSDTNGDGEIKATQAEKDLLLKLITEAVADIKKQRFIKDTQTNL